MLPIYEHHHDTSSISKVHDSIMQSNSLVVIEATNLLQPTLYIVQLLHPLYQSSYLLVSSICPAQGLADIWSPPLDPQLRSMSLSTFYFYFCPLLVLVFCWPSTHNMQSLIFCAYAAICQLKTQSCPYHSDGIRRHSSCMCHLCVFLSPSCVPITADHLIVMCSILHRRWISSLHLISSHLHLFMPLLFTFQQLLAPRQTFHCLIFSAMALFCRQ